MAEGRLSAILRCGDAGVARSAVQAAIAGGFRLVEVTLTTPGAFECIHEIAETEGCIAGAGTVLEVSQLEEAIQAGARYIVSPVVDPEIIEACQDHDVVSIPGTSTPNEMLAAHEVGADLIKLFPAFVGGPAFVRAVLGPLPFLRIVPTSGVSPDNFLEYLEAGAFAVGFVRELFDPDLLAAGRYAEIEQRSRDIHRRFQDWSARQGS